MTLTEERAPHVEAKTAEHSTHAHRGFIAAIAVLALAVVGLGAWVIYDQTTGSDTESSALALDPEIEQLVADYFTALNAYDSAAFGELTTDGYMEHTAGFLSGGPAIERTKADIVAKLDFRFPNTQVTVERLGEPSMMAYPDQGTWEVAQVWQYSGVNPDGVTFVVEETGVFTILDDDGTLKVARFIGVEHGSQITD